MHIDTGTTQLECDVDEGVATLLLNRPEKRNALSNELTPAFRSILSRLEDERSVRCIVITGAGSSFCSGGDVSRMSDLGEREKLASVLDKVELLRMQQRTLTLRLYNLKKPTIAALPGPAAGAGLSIALACDLRYAIDDTFITTGYGKIGLSGDYGGSWLLANLTNPAIAKDLYFSSRRVSARECYRLGIFNDIFAKDDFQERVISLAQGLAKGPSFAISLMKENLNQQSTISLSQCLELEAENLFRCVETDDHKNSIAAFLEKRNPEFKGS